MLAIAFPAIDPIIVQIGPFAIRWYALAYVAGILVGWWYVSRLGRRPPGLLSRKDIDDLVVWITLGVILGGRLGYVLFYKPSIYFHDPMQIFAVWQGGMSFHGGLLGVIVAMYVFARMRKRPWLSVADLVVAAVPIGLFFGRIANFINEELWGRVTDVPWGVLFPHGGDLPRHPSQLYEAVLEGALLFAILAWLAWRTRALERRGLVSGVFLVGYGILRIIGELFREPDQHLGFLLYGETTMGQLLSIPLVVAGLYLIFTARRREGRETRDTDGTRDSAADPAERPDPRR